MSMKFIDLPQSLKKQVLNLYIIKGEDDFVVKSAIKHISNACGNEMSDFNKTILTDENFSAEKFLEACEMLPIGNDRKFILVKSVTKISEGDKQKLSNCLASLPPLTTVVIEYTDAWKFLKEGEVVDCNKLGSDLISKYVKVEVSKNKKKISDSSVLKLMAQCNFNMTKISSELKKLLSYCDDEILDEDIDVLLTKDNEYQIFELSESLGKKNALKSLQILSSFLEKKEPFQVLFSLISNHFRRIAHSSFSNLSNQELANLFSVKEFAIAKAREQSKFFSKAQLKSILEILEETDSLFKNGKMTAENALYYLTFKILFC